MARGEVFVSYSQPDIDVARELVSRVAAHGIECWIAPGDAHPGADWIDAIFTARVMVLVFSASANWSPQVRCEVKLAEDREVSVLPFRIAVFDDLTFLRAPTEPAKLRGAAPLPPTSALSAWSLRDQRTSLLPPLVPRSPAA